MRIYLNCKEAITDIGRELKKCATTVHTQTMQNKLVATDSDYSTKEIEAFSFAILNREDKDDMPGVTLDWLKEEFAERISPNFTNPGEAWKLREEVWKEFLVDTVVEGFDEKGEYAAETSERFEYTYNERMQWQLKPVIDELRKNPETRQAIIEVHDRAIDTERMGKKRVPCSMFYQFMKRDGALDVIYVMRSTDFAEHFQNDIWLADELGRYIARQLGIPTGKFVMFASSLHIYKKDWKLLSNY